MLRRGEFIGIFNSLMSLLRLRRWFFIGESRFFLADTLSDTGEDEMLQLEFFREPTIIPELLDCMAGSKDYAYLTTEEIASRFRNYLERGCRAWVTRNPEGRIAGFFWTTTDLYIAPCGRCKVALELPEDLVFIEFIFIHPDFRRHGLYSKMNRRVRRLHPDHRFACIVDSSNTASIRAHEKLGFRRSGRLLYGNSFGILLASYRFGICRKCLFIPTAKPPYRRLDARNV